jgi:glycosyltransferase involved in cell wall biosynthesis
MAKHVVVVIPAYNESRVIREVLETLPQTFEGVGKITPIVVDDNSSDETKLIAEACHALCVRHEVNLGAGGATKTGFEAAKRLKADIIVTMDGDLQHDPNDMEALIRPILNGQADVVLGSRLLRTQKNMPFYKQTGNNLLNIITFLFFRIWVSDSQSGYKAFSKKALQKITIKTSGYEFCSEIVGEIKHKKLRFREVPIATIYTDYSKAKGQLALNAVNIVLGLFLRNIR